MCMIDDNDGFVTVVGDRYVVARKPYRCLECGREIDAGERYHCEAYIYEGSIHRHKTCAHCRAVREWLLGECGGFIYGGVKEDARNHVEENPGCYDAKLYRAVVGMEWKWRARSGRLLPVPALKEANP
jgi:hypothetical protein